MRPIKIGIKSSSSWQTSEILSLGIPLVEDKALFTLGNKIYPGGQGGTCCPVGGLGETYVTQTP